MKNGCSRKRGFFIWTLFATIRDFSISKFTFPEPTAQQKNKKVLIYEGSKGHLRAADFTAPKVMIQKKLYGDGAIFIMAISVNGILAIFLEALSNGVG